MKIRWTDEERAAVRREYNILSGLTDTVLRLQRAQQVLPEDRQRPFVKQNAEAEVGRWFSGTVTTLPEATTSVSVQTPAAVDLHLPAVVVEIAAAAVAVSQLSWREICTGIVKLLKEDTQRLNELKKQHQQ